MKRIIIVLAMIAGSVFLATPALADEAATVTTAAAPADATLEEAPAPAAEPAADPVLAPAAEEPAAEPPAQEPAAQEPAADPAAQEPVADPAAQDPAAQEPAAQELAADPAAQELAADPAGRQAAPAVKKVDPPPVQHVPVNICHATGSDSNPYVFITPDDDSVRFAGHLAHRDDPNKTWKSDGIFNGVAHLNGDAKPDIIGPFPAEPNNPQVTAATCNAGDITPDEIIVPATVRTTTACDAVGTVTLPTDTDLIHYSFVSDPEVDPVTGAYDILAEIIGDEAVFAGGLEEVHLTGNVAPTGNCPGITPNGVPSIDLVPTCDGGQSPRTNPVAGIVYTFVKGDGITGPWEIQVTSPEPGFEIRGETEYFGDAGNPANCVVIPGGDLDPVASVTPDRADAVSGTESLPNTGGVSLGWLPFSGLLLVAGTMVLARRRTV